MVSELSSFMPGKETLQAKSTKSGTCKDNTTCKCTWYPNCFFLKFLLLNFLCRNEELLNLRGRKYLDALCVYFWATTPVLISILTFSTYAALGHKLTAAKVS